MAFIEVPQCVMATVNFVHGTQAFSNTFWFQKASFNDADILQLATDIDDYFATDGGLDLFSFDVSYVQTKVYDMRSETGGAVTVATGAGPGTVNEEVESIGLSVVVTLYTAARGRTARGRIYVAGFPSGWCDSGAWDANAKTNAVNYCGGVMGKANLTGFDNVVVSRYLDGAPRSGGGIYRPITSMVVRKDAPGFQRRRVDRN